MVLQLTRRACAQLRGIALLLLVCSAYPSGASAASPSFLLGPPQTPLVVDIGFTLHDINGINDTAETFEFVGVLTMQWRDPRQAFDPVADGVNEKVFQGAFQFNELSPGWYPQVFLINEAGLYATDAVVLRVQPDGASTLTQSVNAQARAQFDMTWFPFDRQRLDAVFEVLGFGADEIAFRVDPVAGGSSASSIRVPQWQVRGITTVVETRPESYAQGPGVASAFVVSVDAQRDSWFARRLVVLPLILVVLLSFCVFWMDRSSLGDRLSVSFIGILTAVTYQLVTSDQLPHISYITLMHGFLSISFLTMCATVVINLVVGELDKRGRAALGDLIDRRCRWIFPLFYMVIVVSMLVAESLVSAP